MNALQIGTDSEGGYLVPDEFERTLVDGLSENNIFRTLAHVIQTTSGDRKIPVVASHGSASWVDEEGSYKLEQSYKDKDDGTKELEILRHESSEVVGVRKMTKDRLLIKMQKSAKISVEQLISE